MALVSSRLLRLCLVIFVSYLDAMSPGNTPRGNLSFSISYTLWLAREGGLAASYGETDSPSSLVIYPEVGPRSGFKLGAGCLFHDWDLSFSYSWFNNEGNVYIAAEAPMESGTLSLSTWSLDNNTTLFRTNHLGHSWNNSFNRVDLSLSSYIRSMRPFIGVIFAWDKQSYRVSYGRPMGLDFGDMATVTEWNNDQEWRGIGPYLGISPSLVIWDGDCRVSLCGKSGVALAYSRANVKMRQFYGAMAPTDRDLPKNTYRDIFYYVSPMLEGSLGLCWDGEHGWAFMASISWDIEAWFSHNHMFDINHYTSGRGICSMQGLTIAGGLGF